MRGIARCNRGVAAALIAVALTWLVPVGAARAQTMVSMGSPGDHWASMLPFTFIGRGERDGVYGYKVKLRAADGCAVELFYPRSAIDFDGQVRTWWNVKVRVRTGWLYYPSRLNASSLPNVYPGVLEVEGHYQREADGAIAAAQGFGDVATLGTMTPIPRSVPTPRTPRTHTPRVRSPRTAMSRAAPSSSVNASRAATSAATGTARRLLPAPRQIEATWGATSYRHGGRMTGIEHVMYRHSARSGFSNVSRFTEGTTARSIIHYEDEALRYGTVTRSGPAAFKVEHNLGRVIGTNIAGTPARSIRVFIRDGIIQTAFPI